jgi:hypothetical protein
LIHIHCVGDVAGPVEEIEEMQLLTRQCKASVTATSFTRLALGPGATVPRPGGSSDSIRVWGLPTNFCVLEVRAVVMAFDLEVMCDCCLGHTYA